LELSLFSEQIFLLVQAFYWLCPPQSHFHWSVQSRSVHGTNWRYPLSCTSVTRVDGRPCLWERMKRKLLRRLVITRIRTSRYCTRRYFGWVLILQTYKIQNKYYYILNSKCCPPRHLLHLSVLQNVLYILQTYGYWTDCM
jgi:hypothetical protein